MRVKRELGKSLRLLILFEYTSPSSLLADVGVLPGSHANILVNFRLLISQGQVFCQSKA